MSPDQITSRIEYDTNGGCWLWTGSPKGWGYGSIHTGGKNRAAHRASYEAHKGEIPPGLCVLHKCDVPACVNPDHLFLGSRADNVADRISKGADPSKRTRPISESARLMWRVRRERHGENGGVVCGEAHGKSKLTDADVREIRLAYFSGLQPGGVRIGMEALGKRYGVSNTAVKNIIHRNTWGWLP